MRAELEQVELIEKYLLGQMTEQEKADFRAQLSVNPILAQKVIAQDGVVGAIQRVGIKSTAAGAYVAWKMRKWLMRTAVVILLGGGAFTAYYFATLEPEEECVPCEKHYSEPGSAEHEDAVYPVNCCEDEIEETMEDTMAVEESDPVNNFGFEIILDTSNEVDDLLEGPELLDNNVNNGNNNSTDSDNGETEFLTSLNSSEEIDSTTTSRNNLSSNAKTFYPDDPLLSEFQFADKSKNGKLDKEPSFPGGEEALQAYLMENMNYPEGAIVRGVQGTVYVSFVIAKDGTIKNTKVVKGVDRELNEEAVKVVSQMPRWVPGTKNGKKANLRYTIPVQFSLTGGPEDEPSVH